MDHTHLDKQLKSTTTSINFATVDQENSTDEETFKENNSKFKDMNQTDKCFFLVTLTLIVILTMVLTPLLTFVPATTVPLYSVRVKNHTWFDESMVVNRFNVGIWNSYIYNDTIQSFVDFKSSAPVENWLLLNLRSLSEQDNSTLANNGSPTEYKSIHVTLVGVVVNSVILRLLLLFSTVLGLVITLRKLIVVLYGPRERAFDVHSDAWFFKAILSLNVAYYVSLLATFDYSRRSLRDYQLNFALGAGYQLLAWADILLNVSILVLIHIGHNKLIKEGDMKVGQATAVEKV
ncbi:hypothetical protein WICPIJ_005396 [Wickerhamomyces pijperi]|uniref:Uncharacterized protein n=1 Tax=Wickerhamomyces pijperi TaxID=599730 RepID=A0A9P8TLZ0_WICPI|nr:hypothetical protein WICPIJ_005396 [Wickerhamomyces pijperi]